MTSAEEARILLDSGLCTPRETEWLEAIILYGSGRAASDARGAHKDTAGENVRRARIRMAKLGHAPGHFNSGVAPGYRMGKVTIQRNGSSGDVERVWERQHPDQDQLVNTVTDLVTALCDGIKGLAPLTPAPMFTEDDLLTVYPIGDHHHGMYADKAETGDDYDCSISQSILLRGIGHLAQTVPKSSDALVINLGDFFHANDSSNETPGHSNRLDVDTRYGRVMESGALALIRAVEVLKDRHAHVYVWNMRGNHDPDAAFALAIAMRMYFYSDPRVTIDMGPSLYKYHRFGNNLIGSHHGHGAKGSDLPLIMAEDKARDWGETAHRVWHCGHIHHATMKEFTGCSVETHRTLAAKDAWHAGKGYRSKRGMCAIVYHRERGEIQRTQFHPEMQE